MGIMRVSVSQGVVTMVRFRERKPPSDLARLLTFWWSLSQMLAYPWGWSDLWRPVSLCWRMC